MAAVEDAGVDRILHLQRADGAAPAGSTSSSSRPPLMALTLAA